jgi:hypothetical protein
MLQTMLTTCPDPDPDPDPDPEVPSPEPKSTQIARARESFRPDFERVYALYPRKAGKAAGLASCARQVKTPEQFEELLLAADRFASEVAHEGTEERFIPLFSSWMNGNRSRSWRDSIPSPQERESARVARAFAEKIAADEQAWIDAGGNPFDEDAKARFLAEQRR